MSRNQPELYLLIKRAVLYAILILNLFATVQFPVFSGELQAGDTPFKAFIDDRRTLHMEGTDAAEMIIAKVTGKPASIDVDYRRADGSKPLKVSFRLDTFDRLVLNTRGGADFVNIIDPEEQLGSQGKILNMDGGEGDNVVAITHLPFTPETASQIKQLTNLSAAIEEIGKRAADETSRALATDALKLIDSIRVDVADASKAMAADAQRQVLDPARALVERDAPRGTALGNSIIAKSDEFGKQHDAFVRELTERYAPGGIFPPEVDREPTEAQRALRDADTPDTDVEKEQEVARRQARATQLSQVAQLFGDDARAQVEQLGAQLGRQASGIEQQASEFERKAEQLEARADSVAAQSERSMSADADRVRAVVSELKSLERNFRGAGMALSEEIRRAESLRSSKEAKLAKLASNCSTPIVPTHTWSGSGFFLPIAAPWTSWSITGGAGSDILFGGLVDDDIHGGGGSDFIFGLGGNDQIHGDDGNDILCGEFLVDLGLTGDDCIWGDSGNDLIIGDNFIDTPLGNYGGNDTLSGGAGVDIIVGDNVLDWTNFPTLSPINIDIEILSQTDSGGQDTIEGNDDIDIIFGCGGDDPSIKGNDNMDFIEGNGGNDIIDGGDGKNFSFCNTTVQVGNLLLGGDGSDTVTGGAGIDVIFGNKDGDTLTGKDQVDFMFGGDGKDTMNGDSGGEICKVQGVPIRLGNLMLGGPDKDTIKAGGDLDVMLGQDGDDDIRGYDGSLQALGALDADVLLGGPGDDYIEGDNEPLVLLGSVDFMFGGPGNDEMHGGKEPDLMFGGIGSDRMHGDSNAIGLVTSADLMFGGPDNDWMDGGNSLDVMFGGGGNDTMLGDNETAVISPDVMFGGPGDDAMNGGNSLDVMFGNDGADRMLGDSNLAAQVLSFDFMWGNDGPDYMDGGNAMDLMFGNADCDTMLGDNSTPGRISPDFMFGGPGNDDMDGGNTTDFMWGNDDQDKMFGDRQLGQPLSLDWMWGDNGCDTMFGGQGADVMFGGPGVDQMDGQLGPDLMLGGANSDVMNGGDFADLIFGNEGNDLIHGNDGLDLISGNDGDDCLYGDDGVDLVFGNAGNDCIHGGSHADVLFGNDGDDLILGDNGPDLIFGNAGDDKLDGGSGFDVIFGGLGHDEGWRGPNGAVFFSVEVKHNGSSGLDCDCHIEVCTGKVCVHKFNDLNGDGIQNAGEPNLPGWVFQVTANCLGANLTTDANGNACGDFSAGAYTVAEQPQPGWTATTSTTQTVTVTAGQTTNVSFGNRQGKGELCIRKFNDLNGNGIRDTNEPGLPGVVFQLNGLGAVMTLTTGANGAACASVPAGTYSVVETPQSGWTATTPTTQTVTVTPNQAANVSFGNQVEKVCVLDPGMVSAGNTFARRAILAQTFTPTQTGYLSTFLHGLQHNPGSVNDYSVLVTKTTGGVPAWNGGSFTGPAVLYSASLSFSSDPQSFATSAQVNGQVQIPVSQRPFLTAGTTYALILIPGSPATGIMQWRGNSGGGVYPNGSAYELSGSTWVVPGIGPKDHGFKLLGPCH
jgi:Ca2+-binding RTX toxin-like protein